MIAQAELLESRFRFDPTEWWFDDLFAFATRARRSPLAVRTSRPSAMMSDELTELLLSARIRSQRLWLN
jgi:hypothetical protein